MSNKQTTAKTVEQVLRWVDTTEHHYASAEDEKFFILKGHTATLRIPAALQKEVGDKMEANRRPFDTRMFAVSTKGRRYLRRLQSKA